MLPRGGLHRHCVRVSQDRKSGGHDDALGGWQGGLGGCAAETMKCLTQAGRSQVSCTEAPAMHSSDVDETTCGPNRLGLGGRSLPPPPPDRAATAAMTLPAALTLLCRKTRGFACLHQASCTQDLARSWCLLQCGGGCCATHTSRGRGCSGGGWAGGLVGWWAGLVVVVVVLVAVCATRRAAGAGFHTTAQGSTQPANK